MTAVTPLVRTSDDNFDEVNPASSFWRLSTEMKVEMKKESLDFGSLREQ
jgi:hypothetical protein